MTLVTPATSERAGAGADDVWAAGFPAPNEPSAEEFERINHAWKALLVQQDPSLKDVFAQHPAWEPVKEHAVLFRQDE